MVFAAHGLFGTSAITALTVQSTLGVAATHPVAPQVLAATLQNLAADLPPVGIKLGMLAMAENVAAVAEFLAGFLVGHPGIPVVCDPVVRSSSGRELLSPEGVLLLRERLLPRVTVVTPNLDELAVLTGQPVINPEQMVSAAHALQRQYPGLAVLVTGGHLERPDDLLLMADGCKHWLVGERIRTTSTHGTGCALSSALLSGLAAGLPLPEAASAAKCYVAEALRTATPLGHGNGPLNLLRAHTLSDSHPKNQGEGPSSFKEQCR
jgi:hydroxymethylpyrimidine/phosphomethylpyrimidine kinase